MGGWVHKLGRNGLVHNLGEEFLKYEPRGLSVMFGEYGVPGDCRNKVLSLSEISSVVEQRGGGRHGAGVEGKGE